jgi:hypothetical protein
MACPYVESPKPLNHPLPPPYPRRGILLKSTSLSGQDEKMGKAATDENIYF